MRGLQSCRACLATDVRMCPLERYGLGRSYAALVGHAFDKEDRLPSAVCYECAHRLDAFRIFRKRGRRAHAVLQGLLGVHGEISEPSLRKIDVPQIGLSPSFSWCNLEPLIIEPEFTKKSYFTLKLEQEEPGTNDIEDSKQVINLSDFGKSPSPVPCADKLEYYVSFVPGPVSENCGPEPGESRDSDSNPKPGKVAQARKRATKSGANDEKQTDDGPKKAKRVRKVKTAKDDGIVPPKKKATRVDKVESATKKRVRPKKKRDRARPGALPRTKHTDEYYKFVTVTVLTEDEQVEVFSQRQHSDKYKEAPHRCADCYRGFVTRKCYDAHRARHDDPSQGPLVCRICKLRLKDANLLKKHITMNHRTKFECKKCPHVCTSGLRARNHDSVHAEGHYPCAVCGLVLRSLQSHGLHMNTKHPMLLACPVCGRTYPGQGAVNRHRTSTHGRVATTEYKVLCECGSRFLSEEARDVHRTTHPQHAAPDGDAGAIYCDFCEEKFSDLEATLAHRGAHRRAVPAAPRAPYASPDDLECEQCGLMLSGRQNYVTHYRDAHPGDTPASYLSHCGRFGVLCELCGKEYQSFVKYSSHIQINHHGVMPYKCEICKKSYASAHTLKEHRRIHTKEELYQCTLCNKTFYKKSNFIRHRKVHTDDAPFGCDICGKFFKDKYAMKYHILYVHLKKPWPKRDRGKPNQKTSDPTENLETGSTYYNVC